jgi:cell wall-associated protease
MKIFLLTGFILCTFASLAQRNKIRGWHLADQAGSGFYGISLDSAYAFLSRKGLTPSPVVVAILDDGIDTSHEDLHQRLWINAKEVPGNAVDDDDNGYADDVHGWNFLGGPDGRNVYANSSEWIRVYWRYKGKYEGKTVDTNRLSNEEKYEFATWQKARSGVVGKGMSEAELDNLRTYLATAASCDSLLKLKLNRVEFTAKQLEKYQPANQLEQQVKAFFFELFRQFDLPDPTNKFVVGQLEEYVMGEVRRASGDKQPPEDNRREITRDDETVQGGNVYGNPDVSNGELMHGTHLSGIIAADRDNDKGIKGIADNVRIMMVRTSAEGDEYDKDIAMGIRYAADNGAKLINMSFGKSLSPDKKMIDDAVRYALSKDVLLVQAAGNSKRNIDGYDNYPNPRMLTGEIAPNWITVGASDTLGRAAEFSNYGKLVVNVFAPGVAIYSTIPLHDKYMSWDGTSMASPVVAGVAALLRSYFPKLRATEVKKIIEQSVSIPAAGAAGNGRGINAPLNELCSSGGIVNVFRAVKLAYSFPK